MVHAVLSQHWYINAIFLPTEHEHHSMPTHTHTLIHTFRLNTYSNIHTIGTKFARILTVFNQTLNVLDLIWTIGFRDSELCLPAVAVAVDGRRWLWHSVLFHLLPIFTIFSQTFSTVARSAYTTIPLVHSHCRHWIFFLNLILSRWIEYDFNYINHLFCPALHHELIFYNRALCMIFAFIPLTKRFVKENEIISLPNFAWVLFFLILGFVDIVFYILLKWFGSVSNRQRHLRFPFAAVTRTVWPTIVSVLLQDPAGWILLRWMCLCIYGCVYVCVYVFVCIYTDTAYARD